LREIQGTLGLVRAPMDSICLGTRAANTTPSWCLYGCTTSPLAVPEEEVHTHEYANSRVDIARERYQPVSRVVEGRARHLVGGRGRNMGRPQGINFLSQSRAAHDGAGLSWIWIYYMPGVPQTQGLCEVHGIDAISTAG
jgi:hypothetical protein